MNTIHNARIQLAATALNNLAVAFAVAAFVGPLVASFSGNPIHAAPSAALAAIGFALHFAAQFILGRLRTP
jgi:hypothetical protein